MWCRDYTWTCMEVSSILGEVIGPWIHFRLLLNDYNTHFHPLQKQLCSRILISETTPIGFKLTLIVAITKCSYVFHVWSFYFWFRAPNPATNLQVPSFQYGVTLSLHLLHLHTSIIRATNIYATTTLC